jgi:type IV secretory pathway TrbL component
LQAIITVNFSPNVDAFPRWITLCKSLFLQEYLQLGVFFKLAYRKFTGVCGCNPNIFSFFGNDISTLIAYQIAYYAILIGFFVVALHVMMVIIEFNLAALVATVLLPWAVFPALAFYGDFVIAWLTGALVRVLLTAAMVSIGLPLFHDLKFTLSSGGDPTFYSGLLVGGTAVLFAILSWVLPSRAAAIAGRGVSLGLTGSDVVAGAATGTRFATLGVRLPLAAFRTVSPILRAAL